MSDDAPHPPAAVAPPPLVPPVSPMLAKAVAAVPVGDYAYEPKWDGFRCIVFRDGDDVELGSRGSKPLTRYFPELVEALREQLPPRCVVDGEIVLRSGGAGAEHLSWDALAQRIHPAASRVRELAERTPASFVAFDLLALGEEDLTGEPASVRRARLEEALGGGGAGGGAGVRAPVHLTRSTTDPEVARGWFEAFEGAGLDGVVAKPLDAPYQPGKRVMLKVKHHRTADVVLMGYRVHKSGTGVGSLLLGLHDATGELRQVGGASAFTNAVRLELVEELAPLVRGSAVGEKNRFAAADKDTSWVVLEPSRVCEVRYDQLEGAERPVAEMVGDAVPRFRHTVQWQRWRPDRDPASCTVEQLDLPAAYDLGEVFTAP